MDAITDRWSNHSTALGPRASASTVEATQALLGHRTVGMTEHYSKLTVEDVVKVAALVG